MIEETLAALSLAHDQLRRLVADLSGAQMVAQPGRLANHAAWTLGHLTCSLDLLGSELGLAPQVPDRYPELFLTGTAPVDDERAYPAKNELEATLDRAIGRLRAHLHGLTPDALQDPLPDEHYRAILPTKGAALVHILVGHFSFHVGQVAAWRRALGLPVPSELDRLR